MTGDDPGARPADSRGAWRGLAAAAGAALLLYAVLPLVLYYVRPWLFGAGAPERGLWACWGPVNYDDPYLTASANPAIGRGLFGGLPELLFPTAWKPFMHAWLPLYYWSLGLDHALFGEHWFAWHLHSALLHAACAVVVVLIARRLGLARAAATTAGIVFALHPVATESVAWIASRKDQLAFLWSGLAVLAYLRTVRTPTAAAFRLLGPLALFVALTAKGTALVVPLFLLVHALVLRADRPLRARLLPVLPYAVVAVVMGWLHLFFSHKSGAGAGGTGAGVPALLVADLEVVWLYARSLFLPWPAWLGVEHGVDPFRVPAGRIVLGGATLLVWGGGVVLAWRRNRPAAAVLIAVPLALAPFNNVLPSTSVLFAERYLYIALLPFALGVGAWLAARFDRAAPFLVAAVLGVAAAPRIGIWGDSVRLWEDAARSAPENSLVRMQLADAYQARAREPAADAARWNEAAEAAWRAARRGCRELGAIAGAERFAAIRGVQATTGLGTFLLVTAGGRPDARARVEEARVLFDEAERDLKDLADAPDVVERRYLVFSNRAAVRQALGDLDGAIEDWREAARAQPTDTTALHGLARAQLAAGKGADAAKTVKASRDLAPDDPAAARARADLLLSLGDPAAAKGEFQAALDAHPDDVSLLRAAGSLDLVLRRPVDAEARFRHALDVVPGDEASRTGLASALVQQAQAFAARDDVAGAREAAEKAAEVAPDSSAPDQILGIVARRQGKLDDAAEYLRRAWALQPDGQRIREALASVLVERAAEFADDGRDGLAMRLLEEAVSVGADQVATSHGRVRRGVSGWPALTPDIAGKTLVARQAALRGLALLGAGRSADALIELQVAAAGTRSGPAALRRVALELLARAALDSGDRTTATKAADELPVLAQGLDGYAPADAFEEAAAIWTECGIAARGARAMDEANQAFAVARRHLASATAAGLPPARRELRTGEILFAEENFLDATAAFDRSVEADPNVPEAYLDRAAVWRSHFLLEEDPTYLQGAEEDLRKALAVAPSDARVAAALGEVLLLRRKPSEAFPWLQRAVLADPSQLGARALLADLVVRAGRANLEKYAATRLDSDLEEAAAAARRALALDAPGPGALLLEADVRRTESHWADALRSLTTARERFPESTEARDALATFHRDLGYGYLLQGKVDLAVGAFRDALGVEGAEVDLTQVRERLLGIASGAFREGIDERAHGRVDEAEKLFRRSLRADETAEGWFQLAMAIGTRDDLESLQGAADAYAKALALQDDFAAARLNRAGVLMRLGRPGEAAEVYREWLRRAPEDDVNRRAVQHQIELAAQLEREIREKLPGRPPGDGR